ncbi:MAG: CapA family protein [Pararhodobacter sp.]|nr:CapA family protein [Pararhodobacter sp.]
MRGVLLAAMMAFPTPGAAQDSCRPAPETLVALNACAGAARVSMMVVGDVLLHQPLQWRGYARGFDTIWGAAEPYFRAADLVVANLEGPTAPGLLRNGRRVADPGPVFDDAVYSEYPMFNYHPSVIDALRASGVSLVTTANNHALDRGAEGVTATIAELERRGMAFTGTIRAGAPRDFAVRMRTPLGVIAFIGCTYGTNGLADPHGQVLLCHGDRAELLTLVRAEVARGAGVVVLPHWGQEYSHRPTRRQRDLARDLVAAGAMAVIGTHPHVVQPIEVIEGAAGRSLVAYSTGNFVAAQVELPRATGIGVWAEICAAGGTMRLAGAGYLPLQMDFAGADPVLTFPPPGADGVAGRGRVLLGEVIGGYDASVGVQCQARRARAAARETGAPGFRP